MKLQYQFQCEDHTGIVFKAVLKIDRSSKEQLESTIKDSAVHFAITKYCPQLRDSV